MRKTQSRACAGEVSRSLGGAWYAQPWRDRADPAAGPVAFTGTTVAASSAAAAGALDGAAGADFRLQHAFRFCAWSCEAGGQCMSCAIGEGHSLAGMDTQSATAATGCPNRASTSTTAASLNRFRISVSIPEASATGAVMMVTRIRDSYRGACGYLLDEGRHALVIRQKDLIQYW